MKLQVKAPLILIKRLHTVLIRQKYSKEKTRTHTIAFEKASTQHKKIRFVDSRFIIVTDVSKQSQQPFFAAFSLAQRRTSLKCEHISPFHSFISSPAV